MKLIKKIKIHDITYIIVFLSFLVGYFEFIVLLLITIIIHECGHLLMVNVYNKNPSKIIIYPFGGVTKYKTFLNSSIKEEFLILIFGPLIQILFLLMITMLYNNNLVLESTYNLFYKINIILLIFNLLPILPLDGGKIINLFFNLFLPYKISHKISMYISLFCILIISCIVYLYNLKIFYIIILLLISKDLIFEFKNHKILFNNFLLERVNNNFKYNKETVINDINKIKRGKKHKIIQDNKIYNEKEYLIKYYIKNYDIIKM